MNAKQLGFLPGAILAALLIPADGRAQDYQRSYSLGVGSRIRIHNISGNVKVSGYSGNTIDVAGYKEGRDRDMVEIEDASKGNLLELGVRYPEKTDLTPQSIL
jgi:hypothetical protein